MTCRRTRRDFVKGAFATAAGVGLAASLEEQVLLAQAQAADHAADKAKRQPVAAGSKAKLPMGTIGRLKVSRLILGGNLIGGWAHSRDLMYVSALLKRYHTEEKIFDTLEIAEEHGINCINTDPHAGPLMQKYRKQRGGKILWNAQGEPDVENGFDSLKRLVDYGADSIYVQGNWGDKLHEESKLDVLDKALRFIESQGVPSGLGCHCLDVVKASEKQNLKPDYYVKTIHTHDYFTRRRPEQTTSVIHNGNDNFWDIDPAETARFMKTIDRPWIAFKVMAAGAIPPHKAFRHAFENGADFVMAGMFDFQIAQDVKIANEVLANVKRQRPWRS